MVKWLSHLTLNQRLQVRILLGLQNETKYMFTLNQFYDIILKMILITKFYEIKLVCYQVVNN